jgi:hypothetical protein
MQTVWFPCVHGPAPGHRPFTLPPIYVPFSETFHSGLVFLEVQELPFGLYPPAVSIPITSLLLKQHSYIPNIHSPTTPTLQVSPP